MKCKKCGSPMVKGQTVCRFCGAEVVQNEKKVGKWTMGKLIALASSVVAGFLVVALLFGLVQFGVIQMFWKENDVNYKNSYTVSDFWSNLASDRVVATMGKHTLTNAQLQVFYWMTLYEMMDYYGDYAEYYLGVDLDKPLGDQQYKKTNMTWEQYLLGEAVATWQRYQATADEAEKAGFKMPQSYQEDFATMRASMEETAKKQGFASADEMIQTEFGKSVTFEDYYHYLWVRYTAELYFSEVIANLKFTDAELDAFYQENKADLEAYGVLQDDSTLVDFRNILIKAVTSKDENGNAVITEDAWENCKNKAQAIYDNFLADKSESTFTTLAKIKSQDSNSSSNGGLYQYVSKNQWAEVDVRHILVMPEGGSKTGTDNTITYTEEEWEACRKEAQLILDEYLAGEQTEEAFGTLANKHSDDQNGKVTNGGLYEDVYSGQMVKEFDAWIFDDSRVPGETALVKTQYGYHVMYFVARNAPVDDWIFHPDRVGGDAEMVKTDEGYQILFYVGSSIAWKVWCEEGLLTQNTQNLMNDYVANHDVEVKYWAMMFSERLVVSQ